jgi:hypothetical protein
MAQGWPDYNPTVATNGADNASLVPVLRGIPANPSTPIVGKRLRLDNGQQIRREIVKVYRAMKVGEMDVTKGTKLIYTLEVLSRAVEREAVEKLSERLEAVERAK